MLKGDLWNLFFLILFFIVPVLIYFAVVEFDSIWVIALPYYVILGVMGYYKNKVFQKNNLIKDLDKNFKLTDKLRSIQEKKDYDDFETRRLINEIEDSINCLR